MSESFIPKTKKWFCKLLLGILVPLIAIALSAPFKYKLINVLKGWLFTVLFCFIFSLFLATIEILFRKYESNKLSRVKEEFGSHIVTKDSIIFEIKSIRILCQLVRTSNKRNISYLEFYISKTGLRKRDIRRLGFVKTLNPKHKNYYYFHKSHGILIKKLKRELNHKVSQIIKSSLE